MTAEQRAAYRIDLRSTVQSKERTYDRYFSGTDGTSHCIFAVVVTRPLWGLFGEHEGERRLVFREMLTTAPHVLRTR